MVLLIDDDAFARDALGQILLESGYRVRQASHGGEALQQLGHDPRPGLIVLDLLMPTLNGWEFCEQLRRDPRLADLPIIVVSGIDAEPLARNFSGIVAHFAKPIAVPALLAAIRRYCPLE